MLVELFLHQNNFFLWQIGIHDNLTDESMVNLGLSFYINLLSVIATTYILTWYILTPSPNQCQMTFMMEPPKFLPIEIDEENDTHQDDDLIYPAIKTGGQNQKTESEYKLYMYSEFGFPMAADVRRDLRDSMPVLFVPGNAGSYQQVRSLASTCIRRQLQSLDAFKFIFYTIDFGGQLSGISGDLIDRQTLFVQKSLRQITRMQPTDTGGVILIGHSVGGFISKFLFTKPKFQASSVPLLISLASPLTRPYLVLDGKMGEIYRKTELYWNKFKTQPRDTIALSISGGGSDRLVPMHLSLDNAFDLSLTTESMKDVFLSTDHVCVTWCRELMHKLANLLSALMDRKHTRLISDRSLKLSIIEKELLLKRTPDNSAIISRGDWSTKRQHENLILSDSQYLHRNQLKDSIYIFNRISDHDLLIVIDHIDHPKSSIIFGCNGISSDNKADQITCHGRSDLMSLASLIPTSRYEPRRSIIKLSRSFTAKSINHIGIDCTSYTHRTGQPEGITIQKVSNQPVSGLYIPSLLESLIRKLLFLPIRFQIFPRLNSTTELIEIELKGLESGNSALSISLITSKCLNKGKPNSATIMYYRKGFMNAGAHLSTEAKDQSTTKVKMSLRESIMRQETSIGDDKKSYLDIYLDGTCENMLEVELDILNLAANMFQRDLSSILSCVTFLVTGTIVILTTELTDFHKTTKSELARFGTLCAGSAFVVVTSRLVGAERRFPRETVSWLEFSTSIVLIVAFSYGLLSFLIYFIRRLIDLAIIINNTHIILKRKVTSPTEEKTKLNIPEGKKNGLSASNQKTDNNKTPKRTDIDWPMIGLAIASGPFLSSLPMTVLAIFLLIKASLCNSLNSDSCSNENEAINRHCQGHTHDNDPKSSSRDAKNYLIVNLVVMSSLVLVVNIPDLLLKLTNGVNLSNFAAPAKSSSLSADFAAISLILILKKLIYDRLDRGSSKAKTRWMRENLLLRGLFRLTTSKFTSALTIIPIILIESNIRLITTVALLLSMWLLNKLNFKPLVNAT